MTWQDIAIMAGQFVIAGSLIPSIISIHKPHVKTAVISMSVCVVFAVAFFTNGYTLSFISSLVNVGMWLTLAIQGLNESRKAQIK
jgi:hypothetical protein